MSWFFVALLAPLCWSAVNYIDKYLVDEKLRGVGVGSVMIFSAVIGVFLLPIIVFFHPEVVFVELSYVLLAIFSGFLYVTSVLPYFYALKKDEASIVVPMFQTIPVFSFVLAFFFLGENLSSWDVFPAVLIIVGAVVLSLDFRKENATFRHEVFWLMLLASFLTALNGLIFKYLAIEKDFWTSSFWEYVGFSVSAFLLFFVKPYRKEFLDVLKKNAGFMVGINAFNEVINVVGKVAMNVATIMAPLALAWVVNGLQPFFVLVLGFLITKFFPKIGREDLDGGHVFQKIVVIVLMLLGTVLLNFPS